jgi:spermidine synthase
VKVDLLRDAQRDGGWWLLVGGSEQSFVDATDPWHLEFEYVQMIAMIVAARYAEGEPVTALHLGGGLCTLPRWIAARQPGSRQTVIERSPEIARLAASIGVVAGTTVVIGDAVEVVAEQPSSRAELVVCDVYHGPETVTRVFTTDAITSIRRTLRPDGLYVCNLSDATPFALTKVVAATLRSLFDSVVMVAEPGVLRGRRSGNLVIAAADRPLPVEDLTRRAAAGPLRFRVVAARDLSKFIGAAAPAATETDLPLSGESTGRRLR